VRDEQSKFQERGVQTFGVNPSSVADHEKYVTKFRFNFPILADTGREAARAYQALKPDGKGVVRTVYLIGRDGRVLFGKRGAPGADEVLRALPGVS
jgi:thioredoxin-dependent peroxiredoxin